MPRINPFVKKKNFYLTYHKLEEHFTCRETAKEYFITYFTTDTFTPTPAAFTVGVEDYPTTTGFHCHILLEYHSSVSINRNLFTVLEHVPYFESCSHGSASITRVREYCLKGDITWTNWVQEESDSDPWGDVITCHTRDEAQHLIQRRFPRVYVQSYGNVQSFLNGHFSGTNLPYEPPSSFTPPVIPLPSGSVIETWLVEEFPKVTPLFIYDI